MSLNHILSGGKSDVTLNVAGINIDGQPVGGGEIGYYDPNKILTSDDVSIGSGHSFYQITGKMVSIFVNRTVSVDNSDNFTLTLERPTDTPILLNQVAASMSGRLTIGPQLIQVIMTQAYVFSNQVVLKFQLVGGAVQSASGPLNFIVHSWDES